ncbi:MAG: isoprenylcysteine carboxylmethyltransferase family protein [Chloroflexi bacterium]|nr:isoprenylcysteine carboxylmethyltransferase family protein [Chloroflexota bacterium]
MRNRFLTQAKREYSPRQRLAALLVEAIFFMVIFPFALLLLGGLLDRWLGWSKLMQEPINALIGWLLIVGGWLFSMWSIYVQFTLGRGTPVPLMATQKLIIRPPYAYCRNPMSLGAIVLYLGVSAAASSPGAAVLVVLGAVALLTYIKLAEEKEMIARFGEEYLAYRRRVPFLIPRLRGGG